MRPGTLSRRIFKLPEQPETWVEVDENARYEIRAVRKPIKMEKSWSSRDSETT